MNIQGRSVVALESVLIRLYLESPVGGGPPLPGMPMSMPGPPTNGQVQMQAPPPPQNGNMAGSADAALPNGNANTDTTANEAEEDANGEDDEDEKWYVGTMQNNFGMCICVYSLIFVASVVQSVAHSIVRFKQLDPYFLGRKLIDYMRCYGVVLPPVFSNSPFAFTVVFRGLVCVNTHFNTLGSPKSNDRS